MSSFLRRFAASSRGNVAMIFALTLPVLVMITMGGVDINRAATVRVNLQDALDAAALAAARSSATTDTALTEIGTKALEANLKVFPDIKPGTATFTLSEDRVVIANATVNVKTLVANLVLPPYGKLLDDTIPVSAHSEVNRSSKNIEVALVVDMTGSMAGTKVADLKTAAAQLVDIVVQEQQTPFYTRMAIIPYSIGVNMDTYATGARGAAKQSTAITGASWSTGSAKVITGISKASPAVVSASGHGFVTGDYVGIKGLADGSGTNGTKYSTLNNTAYLVTRIDANSFSIKTTSGTNVNTTGFRTFANSSSGGATKCQVALCNVVITSNSHGIPATTTDTGTSAPGTVYITNVGGMTEINDKPFEVGNITSNTFSISASGPAVTAYTSGGAAWCGQNGCQYRAFRRWSDNALTAVKISTCISERIGSQAYTDASPSTAFVGRNYAAAANDCPKPTIQPLTDDISTLKSKIDSLAAGGSTGAQTGFAWGWYTLSPNFNSLWSSNTAGQYSTQDTLKAVILMTDGEFNSPYCTGVIAQDAANPGSGDAANKISCNAHNGSSYVQAAELCKAMKLKNIVVYTVGFQVPSGGAAADILAKCATGPEYAFLPASGSDLSDDFASIGRDITRLRISK